MDKFEKLIKDAVEGYEAPYNPQAWENVSQGLSKSHPWKWIAGSAAAVLVVAASVVAFNYNSTKITTETANNIVVEETVNNVDGTLSNVDINIAENEVENSNSNSLENESTSEENANTVDTGNDTTNPDNSGTTNNENNSSNENLASSDVENNNSGTTQEENSNNGTESNVNDDQVKRYNTNFTLTQTDICAGSSIKCIPDVYYNDVIYLWEFGDGTFAKGESVDHEYSEAGDFQVTLSLKDKKTNKTVASSSNYMTVKGLPKVDFTWENSNKVIPTIHFINLSDEAESFSWNIQGLKSSTQNEFEYTFREKGVYNVSITATGANGCVNTVEKAVTIEEDYNLLAPTAFTPNGDFMNDDFIPEALKIMDQEFVMTIYDEGGSMVYETRNVNEPWDGNYTKDNVPAPNGGYVWVVKLKNSNGQYETYNGQVFITR